MSPAALSVLNLPPAFITPSLSLISSSCLNSFSSSSVAPLWRHLTGLLHPWPCQPKKKEGKKRRLLQILCLSYELTCNKSFISFTELQPLGNMWMFCCSIITSLLGTGQNTLTISCPSPLFFSHVLMFLFFSGKLNLQDGEFSNTTRENCCFFFSFQEYDTLCRAVNQTIMFFSSSS